MSRTESLLTQLHAYEPADALEERHRAALLELLANAASDPFSRDHFAPGHVTASCFIVSDRELLLHHHRRLNRWLQMGGHVDAEEAPHVAALREGREESGLEDLELLIDGIFDLDVHEIPAAKGEPDHAHFDVRYLARTRAPRAIAIDPNESNDLAWVPLADAVPLMNEPAAARAVRKIERLLA